MQDLPTIAELILNFRSKGIELPRGNVRAERFGDSEALSIELLALIVHGKKRAGAGLLWAYEYDREATANVGDMAIVLDHLNWPKGITQTTRVEILPFNEVTPAFALREGERDGSLESWRTEHWRFFTRECLRIGRQIAETMPVVCESFEVIQVLE